MNRTVPTVIVALLLGLALGTLPRLFAGTAPRLPDTEVQQRVRQAMAVSDRIDRLAGLSQLFEQIDPASLDSVLAVYRTAPLNGGDVEYVPLIAWWARFDVEGAFEFTQSDRRTRYRRVTEAIFREWGARDPDAAIAALRQLRGPLIREKCTIALAMGFEDVHGSAAELIELLRKLPSDESRQAAVRGLFGRELASKGLDAALDWASALAAGAGDVGQDVAIGTVRATAEIAPDRVAALLSRSLTDADAVPTKIYRKIGMRWVERDPEAALTWLLSLPRVDSAYRATQASYAIWVREDRAAARDWYVETEKASEADATLDPVRDAFARLFSRSDPAAALERAQAITAAKNRDEAMVAILGDWLARERSAAEAWMDAAGLPGALRKDAQAQAERRQARSGRQIVPLDQMGIEVGDDSDEGVVEEGAER